MLRCDWVRPRLTMFLLGELRDRDTWKIAGHVGDCPACLQELDQLQRTVGALGRVAVQEAAVADGRTVTVAAGPAIGVVDRSRIRELVMPRHQRRRGLWAIPAGVVAAAIAVTLVWLRVPPAPEPPVGEVVRVSGHPQVRVPRGTWQAAVSEAAVAAGAEFRTGETDQLELQLADGSRVRLDFETALEVTSAGSEASEGARADLTLHAGRVWLLVTPAEKGLRVHTPAGMAEAVGTRFEVAVVALASGPGAQKGPQPGPTASATLIVLDGKVRWSNQHGAVVALAGTMSEARTEAAPGPPRPVRDVATLRLRDPWGGTIFEAWVVSPLTRSEAADRLAGRENHELAEANQLLLSGQTDEATARYRYIAQASDSPAAANNLGVVGELQGDFEQAEAFYRRAVEAEAGVAVYHFNLAMALYRIGNLQHAASELEEALGRDSKLPEARYLLGRIRCFLGEVEAANEQARRLQAAEETRAQGLCLAGEIARLTGDLEAAESWYLKAAQADPRNEEPPTNLGAVYFAQGNLDQAMEWTRRALALDLDSVRAGNRLGLILYRQGKLKEAEAVLLEARAKHPEYMQVHNNLALVYFKQQRLAEAKQSYQRGIALAPEAVLCHMGLAMTLERTREFAAAKQEYRMVLRLDPTYEDAYRRLAALHRQLGETQAAQAVLTAARSYGL